MWKHLHLKVAKATYFIYFAYKYTWLFSNHSYVHITFLVYVWKLLVIRDHGQGWNATWIWPCLLLTAKVMYLLWRSVWNLWKKSGFTSNKLSMSKVQWYFVYKYTYVFTSCQIFQEKVCCIWLGVRFSSNILFNVWTESFRYMLCKFKFINVLWFCYVKMQLYSDIYFRLLSGYEYTCLKTVLTWRKYTGT